LIALGLTLVLAASAVHAEAPAAADEFAPPADLEPGWYARIETSRGRIVARLLPEQAPQAVAHFAALAEGRLEWFDFIAGKVEQGHYYDGIQVLVSEAGRLFQAGDRHSTGYGIPAIFTPPDEGIGPVTFDRPGRLGLARLPGGRHSPALFFVTASGQPWLIRRHPCFGVVVSGREVVQALTEIKTTERDKRPLEPEYIHKVRIFAVGEPAPLPQPSPYEPKQHKLFKKPDPPPPAPAPSQR